MVSPLVLVLPEESDETNPKQILKRVKLLDVDMKKAKVRALVLRWFTPTTRHRAMKTTTAWRRHTIAHRAVVHCQPRLIYALSKPRVGTTTQHNLRPGPGVEMISVRLPKEVHARDARLRRQSWRRSKRAGR